MFYFLKKMRQYTITNGLFCRLPHQLLWFVIGIIMFPVQSVSQQNPLASSAAPTASNFTYPQSLYIDSKAGQIWVTDFSNNRVMRFDVSSLTSVEREMPTTMPSGYVLMQNYPNPFNPTTHITFSSAKTVQVQLIVSDLLGRQLATVFSGIASAQRMYTVAFDARNLASGIYLYSLRSPDGSIIKKMIVIK